MAGPEGLADHRERLEASAPAKADPDAAELARRRASRGRDRQVGLGQGPPGALEQRPAGFGESDLPGAAAQHVGAELLLELADRDAQGWLGHVQSVGGAAEVQLLGDCDEIAQVAQLHHQPGAYPARHTGCV